MGILPARRRERDAPETAGKMPALRTASSRYSANLSGTRSLPWADPDERSGPRLLFAAARGISVGFDIRGLGNMIGRAGKIRAGPEGRLLVLAIDLAEIIVPPIVPGDVGLAVYGGPHAAF